MKVLIVYYSRTNVTRTISSEVQKRLNCDVEEILDTKNRDGSLNYLLSGFDALRAKPAKIKPTSKDPSKYDLVIIATPVWAGTLSNPVLTYINENKDKFKNVAFIATCGSSQGKTFINMEELSGKIPLTTLIVTAEDKGAELDTKIDDFVNKLN